MTKVKDNLYYTADGVIVLSQTCIKCGCTSTPDVFSYRSKDGVRISIALCKDCKRERDKNYRVSNKDKISEYSTNYNRTHRAILNQKAKRYRDAHKELLKERNKAIYERYKADLTDAFLRPRLKNRVLPHTEEHINLYRAITLLKRKIKEILCQK